MADAPDLDELLCFVVHSTDLAFNRIYRRMLQRLNLTYPQYLVMIALWGADDVTVGRLGEVLSLDTNTLTPLLKRLEALGLVTRQRSAADERRVMVALTERGRDLQREAADVPNCIVEHAGLPLGELTRLTRTLRTLRANLEKAASG